MTNFAARSYRLHTIFHLLAVLVIFVTSCSPVIKGYRANTPFVYEVNIELKGKFKTDERKQLTAQLQQQLHDSMQVRTIDKLFYSVLVKPPGFDSLHADRSKILFHALLNSLGYYRDSTSYTTSLRVKDDQQRVTVNYIVDPGKLIHLDSVQFNLGKDTVYDASGEDSLYYVTGSDTLQKITLQAREESLLKKGQPFAKGLISTEFSRLTDVYRNDGFLRFSKEDLVAEWDTVGLALLRPTLDPIEQAQQLQELRKRRANPTADLEVRLRANLDTTHLTRYYVGNVTVYPDYYVDSGAYAPKETVVNGVKIISYQDLFHPKTIAENVYLHRDSLYRQRLYLQTLNRFNSLSAWRLASIDQIPRGTTDTVDFIIKLSPAKKYQFNINVEGSKNWTGSELITQGNLLGLGVNFSLQNRNFAKRSYQAGTNFRFGVELNASRDLFQTRQFSVGHTFLFPRFIPANSFIPEHLRDNFKSSFSLNVASTERLDYFKLTSLNMAWGNDFNRRNKLVNFRFPNIEYTFLHPDTLLNVLISKNASYKYIFNNGLIFSLLGGVTLTYPKKNTTELFRINGEASGLPFRGPFFDSNLYRFVKLDAEYRYTRKIRRTELAWRFFAGAGYELPSTHYRYNENLPFFRQYYAGGSNSMRAWGLRKLGPGSLIKSFAPDEAPDRFGDLQLELNGEYRFYLADISGVKINSALYADVGNVWFLRGNDDFPDGEFRFNKVWKDLAIGVGTGLRIDFGFFLIRVDYAYKVKDPSPETISAQNKWFYGWNLLNGQLQLGVNYPF